MRFWTIICIGPPPPGFSMGRYTSEPLVSSSRTSVTSGLGPVHGRDPRALVEKLRRQAKQGGDPYWAVTEALGAEDFKSGGHPVQLLLLGDCDVHMESDFLRREAAAARVDLRSPPVSRRSAPGRGTRA